MPKSLDPKRGDKPSDVIAYIGLILIVAAGTAVISVGIFKVVWWLLK